jgi:hypothetical protein
MTITNTKFVHLERSWVNLNHVREIRMFNDSVAVVWSNGEEEIFNDKPEALSDLNEEFFVVPAAPGHELLQYFADDGGELQRSPVLAWRIKECQTESYFGDDMLIAIGIDSNSAEDCSNVYSAVLAPDGVVTTYTLRLDRRIFDSIEQWQEAARQHWSEAEMKRKGKLEVVK